MHLWISELVHCINWALSDKLQGNLNLSTKIFFQQIHLTMWYCTGGCFDIKILSYQYRNSHYGDKRNLWLSYLLKGICYTDKMTSLHSIRGPMPQYVKCIDPLWSDEDSILPLMESKSQLCWMLHLSLWSVPGIGACVWAAMQCLPLLTLYVLNWFNEDKYMGQVMKLWLSCYLVLLSTDSKTK